MRCGMRRGFTLLELIVLIVVLAILALGFIIPSLKKSRYARRHSAATGQLKTFHGMMAMWKKKGYAGNGRVYPAAFAGANHPIPFRSPGNLGKYCALHFEVNNAGNRIMLLGRDQARADCRADGNTKGIMGAIGTYTPSTFITTHTPLPTLTFTLAPSAGYWFGLCNRWGNATTQVYHWTNARNRFAIVAFPDDYGHSGEDTYVVNEDGTIYFLDRGEGKWTNYPGNDPMLQNWEISIY